jgi:hypothetical protein
VLSAAKSSRIGIASDFYLEIPVTEVFCYEILSVWFVVLDSQGVVLSTPKLSFLSPEF